MKIIETHDLLNASLFITNKYLQSGWSDIETAVKVTDWPHGTGKFTIFPQSGKKRGQGNGVVPIKAPCLRYLQSKNWLTEKLPIDKLGASVLKTGDLDALKHTPDGYLAFEWETVNITSSHRAVNKLLLSMQETKTLGGFLVVPSDLLKQYLTDRIGNIGELRPYFSLWRNVPHINGALRIIVVEHDATSMQVPRIPKGTDGRSII